MDYTLYFIYIFFFSLLYYLLATLLTFLNTHTLSFSLPIPLNTHFLFLLISKHTQIASLHLSLHGHKLEPPLLILPTLLLHG